MEQAGYEVIEKSEQHEETAHNVTSLYRSTASIHAIARLPKKEPQYKVKLIKRAQILSEARIQEYQDAHYVIENVVDDEGQATAFKNLVNTVKTFRNTNKLFIFAPNAFTVWHDLRELVTIAYYRRARPLPSDERQQKSSCLVM